MIAANEKNCSYFHGSLVIITYASKQLYAIQTPDRGEKIP